MAKPGLRRQPGRIPGIVESYFDGEGGEEIPSIISAVPTSAMISRIVYAWMDPYWFSSTTCPESTTRPDINGAAIEHQNLCIFGICWKFHI